ncbi:hypothetical protein HQ590_13085 [bacterium]|nr:hypothetical protein [bacterium]
MTSRERILAALRRQPVDYVPCAPFFNFQDWPQRVGRRWQYPFGPSVPETLEYVVGTLGLDQVVTIAWGWFPEASVTVDRWVEDAVLHQRIVTPSGAIQAAVRLEPDWPHGFEIPLFSDYLPAHGVEPWLKTAADVECLRHLLLPPRSKQDLERIRFEYRAAKRLADRYQLATCFYFGLGLTGALQVFGAEAAPVLAAEQPELIEAYLELDHQWNLRNYEIALELGADFVRRNGFYETADFYSPAMLERFLGPRLRREIDLVHQAGRPIGYTLLSGYQPLLDYLSGLGFDCLICPDVFLRDGDARALQEKLGAQVSFWTGPSDTVHLPWEKPEAVRAAVRRVFEVFGKTGLLLTPCSSSKAVFPWANIEAMIEEWRGQR